MAADGEFYYPAQRAYSGPPLLSPAVIWEIAEESGVDHQRVFDGLVSAALLLAERVRTEATDRWLLGEEDGSLAADATDEQRAMWRNEFVWKLFKTCRENVRDAARLTLGI